MQDFINYSIRVLIVFIFAFLSTRILTKKAIVDMSAYELAGTMILANVAAEPLVDKITIKSIYGVGLIVTFILVSSRIALVNKLTNFLEHTPTFIMENGKLNLVNLKSMGLSLNQLNGLIHQQGYDKLFEIETIIMEPQGEVSIFPKEEYRNVQLRDFNIKGSDKGFTIPLIMDGSILIKNLVHINKSEEWLLKELKKKGIKNYKDEVAFVETDSTYEINILKK